MISTRTLGILAAGYPGEVPAGAEFALIVAVFVPFARTSPWPARPVTVPPTTYELVAQFTTALLTAPETTVPVPPLTVHVCAGNVGCDAIAMS